MADFASHTLDVLVLGLGITGQSLGSYFAQDLASDVSSVTLYGGADSRESELAESLRKQGVHVVTGTDEVKGSFDLCVASPGIPEHAPFLESARAHAHETISEPELAWRLSPKQWLAITGTNGKTTTTSLTTALLQEAGFEATSIGNIGYLATKAAIERRPNEWFVAELSSFQLALAKDLHPQAAALLNITPDHLSWHGSLERYAAAKERIFANLAANDLAVVCCDDTWCEAIAKRLQKRDLRLCEVRTTVESNDACAAFLRDELLVVRLDGVEYPLVAVEELKLQGLHNVKNALVASALALEAGVDVAAVIRGLQSFSPLEHRVEPCGEIAGVRFVNDSKATNTDAVQKALSAFKPHSVVLLVGGTDKGTDLEDLIQSVHVSCASVVCYGEAGERIYDALKAEPADGVCVMRAAHMADAFEAACSVAQSGQTVLLSPACASFDEFSGFQERGRVFKSLVAERAAAMQAGSVMTAGEA